MNEKTEKNYSDLWNQLKLEMLAKGPIKPGSLESKAQAILEMVAGMLWSDHIFAIMRCHYYDHVLSKPRPDFGKMMEAAKQNGTFPQVVDLQLDGAVDEIDDPDELGVEN